MSAPTPTSLLALATFLCASSFEVTALSQARCDHSVVSPEVTARTANAPAVGVGGSVSVFGPARHADAATAGTATEDPTSAIVREMQSHIAPVLQCYTRLLRRRAHRDLHGSVRVRNEAGRAVVQPGGPAPLASCASRSVMPSGAADGLEVTLVFERGRRRHATFGPIGEPSVPLDEAALRAIEGAIRARAPAADSMASERGSARGVVRVPLRIRLGLVVAVDEEVTAAPAPTPAGAPTRAAFAALFGGICITSPVPDDVTFVLPVRLHGPPPDPNGPLGQAPDCEVPADCSPRSRCVTAAMGGPVGCTGEMCCGGDECANGCASDADCPRCRPRCTARGGDPGACR